VPFKAGDTREAARTEVAHLIPKCLQPITQKAEADPENKAEAAAPANKAETGRKAKTQAE